MVFFFCYEVKKVYIQVVNSQMQSKTEFKENVTVIDYLLIAIEHSNNVMFNQPVSGLIMEMRFHGN